MALGDPDVSRRHVRVTVGHGGITVVDLGSTNGTLVNGQPATRPRPIAAGDVIELGQNRLEVVRL